MPDGYVTFDSTYYGVSDSGNAIRVQIGGDTHWIPNFAIHEDSEIYKGTSYKTGTIHIREDIAEEKGLSEKSDRSRGTGVGIPLKRHRLPDPPGLMAESRLAEIEARLNDCSGHPAGWVGSACGQGTMWVKDNTEDCPIALFEGETADGDLDFVVHAPADISDLLNEVATLRAWVKEALKTQERRVRK